MSEPVAPPGRGFGLMPEHVTREDFQRRLGEAMQHQLHCEEIEITDEIRDKVAENVALAFYANGFTMQYRKVVL